MIMPLVTVVLAVIVGVACKQSKLSDNELEQEKTAIKAVIAMETDAYYKQDFTRWKQAFVDQPYFRSYGYWEGYPEKVRYYNGFDALESFKKTQFDQDKTVWKGSKEIRTNENLRVTDDMAWYTFEQKSLSADGKTVLGNSVETRILEKHEGQWKIAYLGFHYLPELESR